MEVRLKELTAACHLYTIPIPSAGYWTLKQMGREAPIRPLTCSSSFGEDITFVSGRLRRPTAKGEVVASGDVELDLERRQKVAAQKIERQVAAERRKAAAAERDERLRVQLRDRRRDRDQLLLDILCMLSSGVPSAQVAVSLGISRNAFPRTLAEAKRLTKKRTGLPEKVIEHLFAPRTEFQEDTRRYSSSAITVENALALHQWEEDAWEVYQAQTLLQEFGLTHPELQILFRMGDEPI